MGIGVCASREPQMTILQEAQIITLLVKRHAITGGL